MTDYASRPVDIIDMKCDDDKNKKKCASSGVRGYPTIRGIDKNGNVVDYDGARDYNSICKWIDGFCGFNNQ